MIVWILTAGVALILAIFLVMPDLPATPQVLIDSTDLLVNILSQFVGVYKYIMSPSLAFISVTMIIAIFAFEPIYKIALWVLRKIPVFGVK
ncbi:hypothetical protein EUA60_01420 [TM7 phylum sp. oral taxon 346]|jgi:hypothetical protein|nr:hypothetical protein EUA60_01420 [TM7 phylum sp. oral taxon 346]